MEGEEKRKMHVRLDAHEPDNVFCMWRDIGATEIKIDIICIPKARS